MNHDNALGDSWAVKVNEIINSIYSMTSEGVDKQVSMCQQIVSQILHHDLIAHLHSHQSSKLLIYELLLLLAEREAKPERYRQHRRQNQRNNKQHQETITQTLQNLHGILKSIGQKYGRKQIGGESLFGKGTLYHQQYLKFSSELQNLQNQLYSQEQDLGAANKKVFSKDSEEDANEALIEQLEEIIMKKEKRIKQLNDQIEESVLEQKSMEDLIEELQLRNVELNNQINGLREKVTEQDQTIMEISNRIQELLRQNRMLDREMERKNRGKIESQKTMPMQDMDDSISKRQLNGLDSTMKKKDTQEEQRIKYEESMEQMRNILLVQCISIEALIQ